MINFKPTILDKYIFKQVFAATLVCLFLFVIVWIAPEILVRIIRQIFLEGLSIKGAALALFYELPKVFDKALPVGILLGTIFTFDKLSKNSELIVIRSIGVSFMRIIAPTILLGAVLAVFTFIISDRLIPYTAYKTNEDAFFLKHFVYLKKDENKMPEQGIIISDFTRGAIRNLTIVNFSEDKNEHVMKFSSILTAPYALKLDGKWVLPTAKEYVINEHGIYTEVKNVQNYEFFQGELSNDVFKIMKESTVRDRNLTVSRMSKYIKLLKKYDFTDEQNYLHAKYFQRFLHPLTCILFAFLGCLLGYAPPRSQRLIGFTAAVGIVFAYYITLPFFDLMAEKSVLPPILTASLPIIFFILAIIFIKKGKDL